MKKERKRKREKERKSVTRDTGLDVYVLFCYFVLFCETGSCYVAQAGLNPLASASQVLGLQM
jgi:hypothetical protein